jgi:hypothetical protein
VLVDLLIAEEHLPLGELDTARKAYKYADAMMRARKSQ